MSETREILEQAVAQASAQQQSPEQTTVPEVTNGEQISVGSDVDDPYLAAPKSFKKEYGDAFRTLTPELRKYLHERESEVEKGFSKLNNQVGSYKWLDEIYGERKNRIGDIPAQDYFKQLAMVDDFLEQNPQGTIAALAEYYNIDLTNQQQTNADPLQGKIRNLEQRLGSFQQMMEEQQNQRAQQAVFEFSSAKDEKGEMKHPYFADVKETMVQMINSGAAKDLAEAYEKAIWVHPDVREKMLAAKMDVELKAKAAEAQKAKTASFSPNSKTVGVNPVKMSTRDILIAEMRKAGADV